MRRRRRSRRTSRDLGVSALEQMIAAGLSPGAGSLNLTALIGAAMSRRARLRPAATALLVALVAGTGVQAPSRIMRRCMAARLRGWLPWSRRRPPSRFRECMAVALGLSSAGFGPAGWPRGCPAPASPGSGWFDTGRERDGECVPAGAPIRRLPAGSRLAPGKAYAGSLGLGPSPLGFLVQANTDGAGPKATAPATEMRAAGSWRHRPGQYARSMQGRFVKAPLSGS